MENHIKINILGTDYVIKQSFRALLLFEEMSGKNSFNANDTIKDLTTLFYCFLKGGNQATFTYTLDEFIDVLDDNPVIFEDFAEYLKNLNPEKKGSNKTPPKKKRR